MPSLKPQPFRRFLRSTVRIGAYSGGALAVLLGGGVFLVHGWLSGIGDRKAEIEQRLTEKFAHRVRIERLIPHWEGLHPGVRVQGLKIYPRNGDEAALRLPELEASAAWLPFLWGRLELHHLVLRAPEISLERLTDGRFRLNGFEPFETNAAPFRLPAWLFAEGKVSVVDGTLTWTDFRTGEKPLRVSDIDFVARNAGSRHNVKLSARFPRSLCDSCSVTVDLIGNPAETDNWGGQGHLRVEGLNLHALPAVAREHLPPALAGSVDAWLWTQWQHGEPRAVNGHVSAFGLRVPATPWTRPVQVQRARADFDWRGVRNDWNLRLGKLLLGDPARPWVSGASRVVQAAGATTVEIEHVDAGGLAPLLAALQTQSKAGDILRTLKPQGELRRVRAQIAGPWSAPDDFHLEAELANAGVAPYRRSPGVTGLDGHVSLDRRGGRLTVKRFDGELAFPHVFGPPIRIEEGQGSFVWSIGDEHWELAGEGLRARNRDARATGEFVFRKPFDRSRSPWLRVQAEVPEMDAATAADFYPINVLSDKLRAWLGRFLRAGKVSAGRVTIEGDVRNFPFRDGNGTFLVEGRLDDGVFEYVPAWPAAERMAGTFRFNGSEVQASGSGAIRGLAVESLDLRIPDLKAPMPVAKITGRARGPVNDTLQLVKSGLLKRDDPAGLQARGDGAVTLDLSVPLRDPQALVLAGDYRFENVALLLPRGQAEAGSLSGNVEFDQTGLRGGRIEGSLLGGATTLAITGAPGPERAVRFEARGRMTRDGLVAALGPDAPAWVDGVLDWRADGRMGEAGPEVRLEADLNQLALHLPSPLAKARNVPLQLVLNAAPLGAGRSRVTASLGELGAAAFILERTGRYSWSPARGGLLLGRGQVPLPKAGFALHLASTAIDADAWLRFFNRKGSADGAVLPDGFDVISADIGALRLLSRPFGALKLALQRQGDGWEGTLDGQAVSGGLSLSKSGRENAVELTLDRLVVPAKPDAAEAAAPPTRFTGRLPIIHVESKSFVVGDWQLGRLSFRGQPSELGWRIQQLTLTRPEMNLLVKGDWQVASAGQKTDLELELKTQDIGKTLAAFGMPEQIQRGRAHVKAQASWEGAPMDFALPRAQAVVALSAENGQFLKFKQGAGKLLGLFDVRSIARYLSLDFSSIFGKGYVFDSIDGDLMLGEGHVRTPGLSIEGPSADIHIIGRAGIVAEDFDLEVGVTPQLGGSIALVGGLTGGPIGFGTGLLLERIWKKQIAQGTRLVYTVKGPWAEPAVKRIVKEPAYPGGFEG